MIRTVEQRGKFMLCCYPLNGWAVFVYRPDADGDWKSIINGKLSDVIAKWREVIN